MSCKEVDMVMANGHFHVLFFFFSICLSHTKNRIQDGRHSLPHVISVTTRITFDGIFC